MATLSRLDTLCFGIRHMEAVHYKQHPGAFFLGEYKDQKRLTRDWFRRRSLLRLPLYPVGMMKFGQN